MEYLIGSETELAKAMNQMISYAVKEVMVELSSLHLANGHFADENSFFSRCK